MTDFTEPSEKIHEMAEEAAEKRHQALRKGRLERLKQDEAEEEAEQIAREKAIRRKKHRNRCLYLTLLECLAPQCAPELCSACPYGYIHCLSLVVKEFYQKTISFSLILAKQERQFSELLGRAKRELPHPSW